ncbi:golgin subfamily A member 5-like [Liolophura sinensis]|uniref:golgin subfamily A member 5-like n=1 Tax=Liolophura sinensis TaxID=3198878 RepID=UPI003158B121
MSWLSGITDKAGDFLNRLDQSAAEVFHNDDDVESKLPSQLGEAFASSTQSSAYSTPSGPQYQASLTPSFSVPTDLNKLKQSQLSPSTSVVSSPVPKVSAPAQTPSSSLKKNCEVFLPKTSQNDTDDALFEFLNSKETVSNSKKKSQTPPPSRRRNSHQRSGSSASSGKGSQEKPKSDVTGGPNPPEGFEKEMTQSVVSQMTASGASADDLNLDLGDAMSENNDGNEDGEQSNKAVSSLELENRLLRSEIASLNVEMAAVIKRAKDSQDEVNKLRLSLDQYNNSASRTDQIIRELQARENDLTQAMTAKDSQLAVLRVRLEESDQEMKVKEHEIQSLKVERERVLKDHTDSSGVHSQALDSVRAKLVETETALKREKEAFQKAQEEANMRQAKLEAEVQSMVESLTAAQRKGSDERSKLSEMNTQLRTTKASLDAARQELADYKDKAARILQSKERLIASLREGSGASGEAVGVSSLEYDAVKQERDMFREELQQNKMSMENLRIELQDLEAQLQQESDTYREHLRSLEEQMNEEKRRREDSDQELLKQKQELQYSSEELHRQKVAMASQVADREKEIQKLRTQLTTKKMGSTSENELEARVKTLTESLIQKQTMLESLSTEKNSLSLQLERLEQQYRDVQASAVRSTSAVVNVHDDEDVRQRLPAFMREGPSDTEVTRKMKRAANVIDKFSIRLGVFLRRYPIARVFVIMYMALLHLWVMVVLLTYQPEIHGGSDIQFQPKAPEH